MQLSTKGVHLLAEFWGCAPPALSDDKRVRELIHKAAERVSGSIVSEQFVKLGPGVSGVVMIADSHVSIHTWPEERYASLDVYTCRAETDLDEVLSVFEQALSPNFKSVMVVRRGYSSGLSVTRAVRMEKVNVSVVDD
jgi:S-adenosylmethionine decarboxylase